MGAYDQSLGVHVHVHVERFYNITELVNVTLFIAYRRELSY